VLSTFFRRGQVLETFRGKGIYQPAVDAAIAKLNDGAWVHLFGEGKVNQPKSYPQNDGVVHLPRFKWGIGRILMEARTPPIVIPVWLSGFDHLMPEGRRFPYNYLPRLGTNLRITFGSPIPLEDFKHVLRSRLDSGGPTFFEQGHVQTEGGWMSETRILDFARGKGVPLDRGAQDKIEGIRSDVTSVAHRAVEALGRKVSGKLLAGDGKATEG